MRLDTVFSSLLRFSDVFILPFIWMYSDAALAVHPLERGPMLGSWKGVHRVSRQFYREHILMGQECSIIKRSVFVLMSFNTVVYRSIRRGVQTAHTLACYQIVNHDICACSSWSSRRRMLFLLPMLKRASMCRACRTRQARWKHVAKTQHVQIVFEIQKGMPWKQAVLWVMSRPIYECVTYRSLLPKGDVAQTNKCQ